MADKTIALDVDVKTGDAEKKTASLKSQLRAMKAELLGLDEGSEKFKKLSTAAGELEDKIGDVNQRVKALASDTKNLDGLVGVAQGIAGGFAAAQGAIALFADENENLQKAILKVQAAQALLSGVQEIANQLNKDSATAIYLKTMAEKAYAAAVGTSTGAMKGFRLALIATGIGALVVALGLVVANWEKITKAINESTGPLKNFGKQFDEVKKIASGVFDAILAYYKTFIEVISKVIDLDFSGAVEAASNLGSNMATAYQEGFANEAAAQEKERQDDIIRATIGDTNRLIQRMEAAGKDTFKTREKLLQDELSLLEKGTEEYLDKQNEIEVLRLAKAKENSDKWLEAKKKADEKQKQEDEKAKAEQEKKDQEAEDKRIAHEEAVADVIKETREEIYLNSLEGQERELAELEIAFQEKMALVAGNEEAEKLLRAEFEQSKEAVNAEYAAKEREAMYADIEAKEQIQKEADDKELAAKKALEDAKRELIINSALGILGALKTINDGFAGTSEKAARKQFNNQKALSIAETTISTFSAAQKAFSSTLPGPGFLIRAAAAAGVAVVSGLARVAAIAKTKFDASSFAPPAVSAPAGGGDGGEQASQAPNPQLSADIQRTRLGAGQDGDTQTRVIVVESDITKMQNKVERIERKATVE